MSERLLEACKELIDDAEGCVDLVFKEVCLEVLSRTRNVLSEKQFNQLVVYASEKMKEKTTSIVQPEIASQG